MHLHHIRKEYEKNYNEMLKVIAQMGGDDKIKFHRKHRTPLYQKLQQLQKREHYLDQLENKIRSGAN